SADAVVQHLPAVHRLVRNARGPASADEIGAVDELLEAERAAEAADDRRQARGLGIGQEHLEPATAKRKLDADLRQQRRAPRAPGHERDIARQARAGAPDDGHHARALDDERLGAQAFLDAYAEPSSRRRPRTDRGDGLSLSVDRTVNATATLGREAGRQAVRGRRVDQLHRDAVGALRPDRRARLGPARLVERHPQTAAAAVAGLCLELAVEVGPATETLERHRALG